MKRELILQLPDDASQVPTTVTTALQFGITSALGSTRGISAELRAKMRLYSSEPSADVRIIEEAKVGSADVLDHVAVQVQIERPQDIDRIARLSHRGARTFLVETLRDRVIPLENLLAAVQRYEPRILVRARDTDDVEALFGILEHGVHGVVLPSIESRDVTEVLSRLRFLSEVSLEPARITAVQEGGVGDRVCVDTTRLLPVGTGLLVGSQAHFFFVVHNETIGSAFSAPRPFRVNAGAVHSYVLLPDGSTRYLSELRGGDRVLLVDTKGNGHVVTVGRAKTERRGLRLVRARCTNSEGHVVLQYAETIRFVAPDGAPRAITDLREGDEVLVHVEPAVGRHFGQAVAETIHEQ